MYFIRLQGCSVGCYFCDTKYTWRPEDATVDEEALVSNAIANHVKWVCITGGEPCEQNLSRLIDKCKEHNLSTQLETSGTVWQESLPWIDWITLSPKDLFSKRKTLPEFKKYASEIKVVVTKISDLEYYLKEYYRRLKPFIIQFVDNNFYLLDVALKRIEGLQNVRIMMQQHKVMLLR